MTPDEFRNEMEAFRLDAISSASSFKEPMMVLQRLQGLYEKFDASEKKCAQQVLSGWILSEDPSKRFDAVYLVRTNRIAGCVPALSILSSMLSGSDAPGDPDELRKVNEVVAFLGG